MTIQEFLSRLRGVRRSGSGWVAHCPAHDDRKTSLSVSSGEHGRLLVHCFAGCTPGGIAGTLGLDVADLFGDDGGHARGSTLITRYEIRDPSGMLVAIHVRQDRPSGKWMWWERPNGERGLGGRRVEDLPLYGVHELAKAPPGEPVIVTEGEPVRDALRDHGFVAVGTVTGAAGTPSDNALRPLLGRRVVLWPDADEPGRAHMSRIAAALRRLGHDDVRELTWAEARKKDDAVDFFKRGGTVEQLRMMIEDARRASGENTPEAASSFRFVPIAELLAQPAAPAEHLVDGLLPLEGISVIAGRPKVGKTVFCRNLAAAVARGAPFLGRPTTPGPVLYASLEDGQRAVAEHFRRIGVSDDTSLFVFCGQAPPDALATLRVEAERLRPRLIIIDTMFRLARVRDAGAYAEVLAALGPLLQVARELPTHVLLVHHAPKGSDSRDVVDAPLGSISISGTADVILTLKRSGDRRTLAGVYRSGAGEDFPETLVQLDPGTGVLALGPTRHEADEAEAGGAILAFLAGQAEPVEEGVIHEAVEGRRAIKVKALRALVDRCAVARTGAGKKGDPYRYQDSGSLVPTTTWEPAEPESETPPTARHESEDSGTGEIGISDSGSGTLMEVDL